MPTIFDPAIVPDPFQPILPGCGSESGRDAPHHASLQRQRARRSAILAATRRLLAQGHEHFTLKRVADECEVTVQTVRNSFGRREDLLVSALNDYTTAIWAALARASSGPMLFLDLAQMYYHCARATPTFLRGMVTEAVSGNQKLAALQRHGALIKTGHLRDMAQLQSLRPGIDLGALAAQITRLNTFMIYEWAMNGDTEELRHQMIAGNTLLLLGVVEPGAMAGLPQLADRVGARP